MPDSQHFEPGTASPLAGLASSHGGITLTERPAVAKINLRGDAGNPAFSSALETVIGCPPPVEPNTVATAGEFTVFWLGPDEWQVHREGESQVELVAALREALGDQHAAVVDVSDYYVVMRLEGDKTLEVLSKGTSLDLHPRAFPAGRCAQTMFGHATVLLHKISDDMVDLQVRWSFAAYTWSFIVDGTLEYTGS